MRLNRLLVCAAGAVLLFCGSALWAAQIRVIENPVVDYSVTDAGPFDGNPDSLTSVFGSVGVGLTGEERTIAEFDLSLLGLSPNDAVTQAFFEVKVLEIAVSGYGLVLDNPDQMSVYGFFGDGLESLADYGTGTLVSSVNSANMQQHQAYSFDVTGILQQALAQGQQYLGLTIRADELGFTYIREGGADVSQEGYPKLVVTTVPEPSSVGLALVSLVSFLAMQRNRMGATTGIVQQCSCTNRR